MRKLVGGKIFFYRALKTRKEGHVVGDVESTVAGVPATVFPTRERSGVFHHACDLIMIGAVKILLRTPRIPKIILRAGSEGGGKLLSINKKLFIPFPPPTAHRIPDVQH